MRLGVPKIDIESKQRKHYEYSVTTEHLKQPPDGNIKYITLANSEHVDTISFVALFILKNLHAWVFTLRHYRSMYISAMIKF